MYSTHNSSPMELQFQSPQNRKKRPQIDPGTRIKSGIFVSQCNHADDPTCLEAEIKRESP